MKTKAALPLALLALVTLAPLAARAASNNDLDAVVSNLEHRYSAHVQHVPMMGFVSLCARVASGGGVKDMRVVELENMPALANTSELEQLLSSSLGNEWQRFVTTRDANGNVRLIFARPSGTAMRMLIADYQNGELNLVRMELNGDRLQHWMNNPRDPVLHHRDN